MVTAASDVVSGVKFSAVLTDDDASCRDELPAERFYAQTLRIAVSSVFRASYALLMLSLIHI